MHTLCSLFYWITGWFKNKSVPRTFLIHIWETTLSMVWVTNAFFPAAYSSFDLDYIFCHAQFLCLSTTVSKSFALWPFDLQHTKEGLSHAKISNKSFVLLYFCFPYLNLCSTWTCPRCAEELRTSLRSPDVCPLFQDNLTSASEALGLPGLGTPLPSQRLRTLKNLCLRGLCLPILTILEIKTEKI